MTDPNRRAELGRFLRARRLALQPEEVGVPTRLRRRRTPGLRREEVADRAAISVSWYTWLEQGRDIHASEEVLDSVADSLLLDSTEREYIRTLARRNGTGRTPLGKESGCLDGNIQRILESQEPNPGYAIDRRFHIIGWNQAALDVFGDFSAIPADERDVLHLLFCMLRPLLVNWEPNAQFVLGTFRASTSDCVNEPWFLQLVGDLSRKSSEFRCWWPQYNVELRPVAYKVLAHPLVGRMVLEQTALLLDDGSARRLILYTPQPGTETGAKLRQLSQRR